MHMSGCEGKLAQIKVKLIFVEAWVTLTFFNSIITFFIKSDSTMIAITIMYHNFRYYSNTH